MLAIDLVKVLLGIGAYILAMIGIGYIYIEKKYNIANTFLMLAIIALILLFHI